MREKGVPNAFCYQSELRLGEEGGNRHALECIPKALDRTIPNPCSLRIIQVDECTFAEGMVGKALQAPLEPYAAPKAVVYFVLAAEAQRREAGEFIFTFVSASDYSSYC